MKNDNQLATFGEKLKQARKNNGWSQDLGKEVEDATPSAILRDRALIRKFEVIEKMSEDDKHVIVSLIDAYIKNSKSKML